MYIQDILIKFLCAVVKSASSYGKHCFRLGNKYYPDRYRTSTIEFNTELLKQKQWFILDVTGFFFRISPHDQVKANIEHQVSSFY